MKTGAVFDILGNFPILFYHIFLGFPTEDFSNWFKLYMALKTLRLFQVKRVTDTLKRLMEMLSDIFFLKRYMFNNVLSWIMASFKFLLTIHYFACLWIYVTSFKEEQGLPEAFFIYEDRFHQYYEALYLMTTTISTVGYGDYKAFVDTSGDWTNEMIYLIFATISGIILFSSVTREIFNYRKLLTIKEIVKQRVRDLEIYLYDVNKVISHKSLPP